MAWTTNTPEGEGATTGGSVTGPINYYTYRNIKGYVEMRLTDVTFASGFQFHYFSMYVQLLNSAGQIRAAGNLGKYWGVPPGFTGLGSVSPGGELLRIRITSTYYEPSGASGQWFKFKSELRWNPDLV